LREQPQDVLAGLLGERPHAGLSGMKALRRDTFGKDDLATVDQHVKDRTNPPVT